SESTRGENQHRAWPDFLSKTETGELYSSELWRALVRSDGPGTAEAWPSQLDDDVSPVRQPGGAVKPPRAVLLTHSHWHDYIEKGTVYFYHSRAKFVR